MTGIATGTDGAVWFFEVNTNKLGRITPDGSLSEFLIPGAPSAQGFVAVAKDGSVWVTGDRAGTLTRREANGTFTQVRLGLAPNQPLRSVLVGPDGEIWFLARGTNKLGRITSAGVVTEFPVLPPPAPGLVGPAAQGIGAGVTLGPDNAMWFIDGANGKVGRWLASSDAKEFEVPGGAGPRITSGPDGALWFTEFAGNKIGRITVDGAVTEFPLPEKTNPIGITTGPDRAIWFTAYGSGKIGRMTVDGQLTLFDIPTANSTPFGITTGTDGNIWFTGGASGRVGRVRLTK
ncbi:MAG: virginiamycin B lyase [Candidatus Dormibacteraceae bacterium]